MDFEKSVKSKEAVEASSSDQSSAGEVRLTLNDSAGTGKRYRSQQKMFDLIA